MASDRKGSCVPLSCYHALSLAELFETAERENGLSSNCSRKLCETDTSMSSLAVHSSLYQPAEKIFLQMVRKHQIASLGLSYLPDCQAKIVSISVSSRLPLPCYAPPIMKQWLFKTHNLTLCLCKLRSHKIAFAFDIEMLYTHSQHCTC